MWAWLADAEHLGVHLEDGELTVQNAALEQEHRDLMDAIRFRTAVERPSDPWTLLVGVDRNAYRWRLFLTGWRRLGMAIAFDQPAWEC